MGMTAFADSENAIIRHELVSASCSKNRCTRKIKDPFFAVQVSSLLAAKERLFCPA